MLTIVGGGPGLPGLLTQAAVNALERAETIYVEPEVREVLSGRRDLQSKVRAPGSRPKGPGDANGETVWVVPDTPALFAPVRRLLERFAPAELASIRLLSGVPSFVNQLDRDGVLLPEHAATLHDAGGQTLVVWSHGRWEGPWLHQRIPWETARPLHGRQVILLRGGRGAQRARRWLEDWGAEVQIWPVSRLSDPDTYEPVDQAIRRIARYDWIIFTSGEAAERWLERMQKLGQDIRQMRAKIATVGPETAAQLREHGLVADLMPSRDFSQEGLAEAFREVPLRGSTVLFPGGQLTRDFLSDELRGRGALVDNIVLYRNQPVPLSLSLRQAIRTESADAMLVTAASQCEYLMDQLTMEDRRHLERIPVFSIGPLTTRTLQHYGIEPADEAVEPSLRLLVECVRDYYARESEQG